MTTSAFLPFVPTALGTHVVLDVLLLGALWVSPWMLFHRAGAVPRVASVLGAAGLLSSLLTRPVQE